MHTHLTLAPAPCCVEPIKSAEPPRQHTTTQLTDSHWTAVVTTASDSACRGSCTIAHYPSARAAVGVFMQTVQQVHTPSNESAVLP